MESSEIAGKIKNLRSEINSLKQELDKLNQEKENLYKEKEKINSSISDSINQFRIIKDSLNNNNISLQEFKKEKDELRERINGLITKIKEQNKVKQELQKKYGREFNPVKIKLLIEKLEQKIETEALSVDKEKNIMKKIKSFKKKLKDGAELANAYSISNKLSREIQDLRNKYSEVINRLKETSSNLDYKELKSITIEIQEKKKKREEFNNKIRNIKDLIINANIRAREKLNEISSMDRQIRSIKDQISKDKKLKSEKIIEDKFKIVEEKIKRGEKLTKEDLQVYQYSQE